MNLGPQSNKNLQFHTHTIRKLYRIVVKDVGLLTVPSGFESWLYHLLTLRLLDIYLTCLHPSFLINLWASRITIS